MEREQGGGDAFAAGTPGEIAHGWGGAEVVLAALRAGAAALRAGVAALRSQAAWTLRKMVVTSRLRWMKSRSMTERRG